MSFSKIPKKKVYNPNNKTFYKRKSKAVSVAGRLYEAAMENSYTSNKGRRPEFRPSSFPLCSILTFMKLQKGCSIGKFEETVSASSHFFTGVGTYAHENIQHHIGFSGKIFGDWKCRNLACNKGKLALDLYNEDAKLIRPGKLTRKNSTNNLCPCCGEGMEYVEKEIKYKGLKGHIDCIIKMSDGRYWVADYKTTTKNKLQSRGKLPEKKHLKQLPTYCYILKKKYGMDIAGFSLIYFSRDNPFDMFEYAEDWSKRWDLKCKTLIAEEKGKFKAGVKSFELQDPSIAIKNKPCMTRKFYDSEIDYYTPCPMLDVCFNEKKLRKTLDDHIKEFPTVKSKREDLIQAINIK